MSDSAYQRLVLKLSGEVLAGDKGFGIDPIKANNLAQEIKSIHDMGVSIGLIIGAGNIFTMYIPPERKYKPIINGNII